MAPLSLALSRTDRTWPIIAGDLTLDDGSFDVRNVRLEEIFVRQLADAEFDVAETSLASYLIALGRGDRRLTAIPVFLSRSFRHNAFFVRPDSSLEAIDDLRGVRIGVPEYQMTAAVWARRMLRARGIGNADNEWLTYRPERVPVATPARRGNAPDIVTALLEGEIDVAFIVRRPPATDLQRDGSPGRIRRLYRDPWGAERADYAATGIFPIMHLVSVRRSLVDERPQLARALFDLFAAAKTAGDEELHETTLLAAAQPWLVEGLEAAHRTLGPDLWPYGVRQNWPQIESFIADLRTDGLLDRALSVTDVFAAATLDT